MKPNTRMAETDRQARREACRIGAEMVKEMERLKSRNDIGQTATEKTDREDAERLRWLVANASSRNRALISNDLKLTRALIDACMAVERAETAQEGE